jgi:hypothetical protein
MRQSNDTADMASPSSAGKVIVDLIDARTATTRPTVKSYPHRPVTGSVISAKYVRAASNDSGATSTPASSADLSANTAQLVIEVSPSLFDG